MFFSQVIAADDLWRRRVFELEQVKKDLNAINKEIGQRKKVDSKDPCDDLVTKTFALKEVLPRMETEAAETISLREKLLRKIGNLVDPSVIAEQDENNNEVSDISWDYYWDDFQLLLVLVHVSAA